MVTEVQKKAYLKAIGFQGKLDLSFDTLKRIVEGHAFAFPYENLNIHDSKFDLHPERRSSLSIEALSNKLVNQHRGGRCVELNLLLQAMLSAFGFQIKPILCDTLWHEAQTPKAKRPKHTGAVVTLAGKEYLVDAAFGGMGILSPLKLTKGEHTQFSEKFKLSSSQDYPFELQVWRDEKWVSIYGFSKSTSTTFDAYQQIDNNNRNPLNPNSYFKNVFICTKPFKINDQQNGRYRIFNGNFIIFRHGKLSQERKIVDETDLHQILKEYFGIDAQKHHYRYRELDMAAFQVGIHRPPVLHRYNTRLKEKYLDLAAKHQEALPEVQMKERLKRG